MTKRLFSFLLAIVMTLSLATSAFAATDKAQSAADTLYSYGLFRGTGKDADGKPVFELDRQMTRQEAVTMLVRLLGAESKAKAGNYETPFTDVSAWAKPYVGYAYANGLTNGTSRTTFGGTSTVTAAQYATFLLRALGYKSDADFVWSNPWALADRLGVSDGSYTSASAFYRGDAAILSLGALGAKPNGLETTLLEKLRESGAVGASMTVSFIDVGQADCILVKSGKDFMLIDAGNNDDSAAVVSYLKNAGVSRLDYAIGTHPHEDHIGGLDAVINNFDIGTLIMPNVTNTTKTFEDVLDAAAAKNLSITLPEVGKTCALGSAEFTIIAPCAEYGTDYNDWSVGIKLVNGGDSFVMCGDAEAKAEADIAARFGDFLDADVLKAGHHGSRTSTSDAFLAAVSPTYAVISCGVGNDYGHPHAETLAKLQSAGVKLFRTDLQGTIIATSSGSGITWSLEPCA